MSTAKQPIKRAIFLQPLSKAHHFGLLFSWKIRTGLKKGIEINRLVDYAEYFYNTHLLPHFEIEEKQIFPILGKKNELVKKAIAEHRRLKRLFVNLDNPIKNLSLIEEELEAHIRFEERILFNEIQLIASQEEIQIIEKIHFDKIEDVWMDEF